MFLKKQDIFEQKYIQQLLDSCSGPFGPFFGGNFTNSKNLQEMCAVCHITYLKGWEWYDKNL